jgi:hypothetical protein
LRRQRWALVSPVTAGSGGKIRRDGMAGRL